MSWLVGMKCMSWTEVAVSSREGKCLMTQCSWPNRALSDVGRKTHRGCDGIDDVFRGSRLLF